MVAGCISQSQRPADQELITLVQSKRGAAIAVSDRLQFELGKFEIKPLADKALDGLEEAIEQAWIRSGASTSLR